MQDSSDVTITMPTWFCKAGISHMHSIALLLEPAEQAVAIAAIALPAAAALLQEGNGSDLSRCLHSRGLQVAGGLGSVPPPGGRLSHPHSLLLWAVSFQLLSLVRLLHVFS